MKQTRTHLLALLVPLLLVVLSAGAAVPAQAELLPQQMLGSYVSKPDAAFAWERGPVVRDEFGVQRDLLLTSQVWRGITWQHTLRVFVPAQRAYPGWMGLLITGGDGPPRLGEPEGDDQLAKALATAMKAPVAVLYRVPNQPILGGLEEDDAISLTFAEFLKSGDPTWPLLFPMVKSAVRAMDALQAYFKQDWQHGIHSFLVTGASKRGWTTWLTGAYDRGRRVKAIAPMVIDMLNMTKVFPHQRELWGAYSEEIGEYTSKGLTEILTTPQGRRLVSAVDPYAFRQQLTMPKLLVMGANDPYWATDALNFYWDGLLAPKAVLYCPNSGHEVETDATSRVVNTMSEFFRRVASGRPLPKLSWQRQLKGDLVTLTVRAPGGMAARAWVAKADNLDFRPQKWEAVAMQRAKDVFSISVRRPADKNMAVFGEVDYSDRGQPYTLSTQNIIARR